jgi:hypothetical protein
MLTIGDTHEITFKVNVMGTSAAPTVRLVFGTHPELGFHAHKQGEEWMAKVTVPHTVEPGDYPLRVEAVVNHRVFTPLTKMVTIVGADTHTHHVPSEEPLEDVIDTPMPTTLPGHVPQAIITPELAPAHEEVAPKKELPLFTEQEVQKRVKKETLGLLKKMAESTHKRAPIKTMMPAPGSVEAKPIKVTLAEVNTMTIDSMAVDAKAAPKKKSTKKLVEIKHELPVRLVKGGIVYE